MPQSSVSMAQGQSTSVGRGANSASMAMSAVERGQPSDHPTVDKQRVNHGGLKFFSRKAFEHLLFPLHASVYRAIDLEFQRLDQHHPGAVSELCTVFDAVFRHATMEAAAVPPASLVHGVPLFDMYVFVDEGELSKVRKCDRMMVRVMNQPADLEKGLRSGTNHLVLGLTSNRVSQTFMVPLALVLQAFEPRVCRPGTFQVYEHMLGRQDAAQATSINDFVADAGRYVGITSRTWQQRSLEHTYAARRGSHLLFHRALRGDLFDVRVHEHIVLRAGLSRSDALRIEEIEVEKRTLHGMHPNGLNMIPGGEAGLRFLSSMTKRPAASIKLDEIDDLLEMEVNRSLRQPGLGIKGSHTNAKLAKLWETDIHFRIKAMTNQGHRLCYRQIRCARLWHASGWPLDKILDNLSGMDGRVVTHDQLKRLLDGKSYASIPHVLIPIQTDSQLDA